MKSRILRRAGALLLALTLACSLLVLPASAAVQGVRLDNKRDFTLEAGETKQLSATVQADNSSETSVTCLAAMCLSPQ